MVPTRHLAGAAPTGAVAGEAETQVHLIWNQTRRTGEQNPFEENQDSDVNGESMDMVDHEICRAQGDRHHGYLATYCHHIATEGMASHRHCVGGSVAGSEGVEVLQPLSEDWPQLNPRIREHILGTTESPHRVVVNVQTEAVEAQENANPVEVRDDGVTVAEYPIEQVIHVLRRIVIAHHEDGGVGTGTDNQKTANPNVVGEQR